jgi:hypothetical protein
VIVTVDHFRTVPGFSAKPGFCATGGRLWFARHARAVGCTWREFLKHGIAVEQLERVDDAFVRAIVAHARSEAAHGR